MRKISTKLYCYDSQVVTDSELDHEEGSAKLEAQYSEKIASLEWEIKNLQEVRNY
jgi:hypothetical protein